MSASDVPIPPRIEGEGPFIYEPRTPEQNRAFVVAFLVNRWERKANDPTRCSYEQLLNDIANCIGQYPNLTPELISEYGDLAPQVAAAKAKGQ